jgi:hypothetical protein
MILRPPLVPVRRVSGIRRSWIFIMKFRAMTATGKGPTFVADATKPFPKMSGMNTMTGILRKISRHETWRPLGPLMRGPKKRPCGHPQIARKLDPVELEAESPREVRPGLRLGKRTFGSFRVDGVQGLGYIVFFWRSF